jgi:hypothetical protein
MKKLLYLLLFIPLVFACSSDDDNNNNNTSSEPTNFYEAHNGVWVTTYEDGSQNLLDIYDDGWVVYARETNSGCWGTPPSINSGSTTTYTNTPDELYGESINITPSDMFSGDELQAILDAGYTTVSVAQSYLNYNATVFTWVMIIYAGTFEEELLTVSSTFVKQSSNSFSVCREMSNYNISVKTKILLNNQVFSSSNN